MTRFATRHSAGVPALAAWAPSGLLAAWALHAAAEPLPADPLDCECWPQSTHERTRVRRVEPTAVDVDKLRDGAAVNPPFRVDSSIRGRGFIPAGKPHPKAGHHHLLVDMALPRKAADPIPCNDAHRHFDKGQTRAVLALPPGTCTSRLRFVDDSGRRDLTPVSGICLVVSGQDRL